MKSSKSVVGTLLRQLTLTVIILSLTQKAQTLYKIELGRYRFCKSVSVFSKVGFGIGFSKYRDIGFGFSARTYHCLSNNTIADTLRPSLSPEWGLGPSNLHYKLRP